MNKEICFACRGKYYENRPDFYPRYRYREFFLREFNQNWKLEKVFCHKADYNFINIKDELPSTCSYLLEQTLVKELKDVK